MARHLATAIKELSSMDSPTLLLSWRARVTTVLDAHRPVELLHNDRQVTGWLEASRRDGDGWWHALLHGGTSVDTTRRRGHHSREVGLADPVAPYLHQWPKPTVRIRVLLLVFLGLTFAAAVSGLLLWASRKSGAVLNLVLLPVEAVFWVCFALPIPWLLGIARVVLVSLAWPSLFGWAVTPRPLGS